MWRWLDRWRAESDDHDGGVRLRGARVSRSSFAKWLYVGLHIKRWLLLILVGVVLMALGIAYLLREVYVSYAFPDWVGTATLQFLPRWVRGVLFISAATVITVLATWKLNRSLVGAVVPLNEGEDLVSRIWQQRTQDRGPKVAVIGGGTGLSTLLRGLKSYTGNISAIVTVADDGGSSGVLRRDLNVIPPGDIRNCIAALADAEPLVTRLFQYRFGDDAGHGIAGHSFGNLFIVAMSEVTGNMEVAIRETSRVLAVRGRILPATLANITLGAQLDDGSTVHGESVLPEADGPIERVFIEPADAPVNAEVVAALLDADLIVIGPGSLYTSVLPNLLVPGLAEAVKASRAHKVYVSNVATQHGETDAFDAADHYAAIRRHLDGDVADVVLANSNLPADPLPPEWQSEAVLAPGDADYGGARLVLADLVDPEHRYRHDSERLAAAVMRQYYERDLRTQAPVTTAGE
jgi:uncharacterized cofD-like protein